LQQPSSPFVAGRRGRNSRVRCILPFNFARGQSEDLPAPRPPRRNFVYGIHPASKGIHLRFRRLGCSRRLALVRTGRMFPASTESLGLFKGPAVKNAVIGPVRRPMAASLPKAPALPPPSNPSTLHAKQQNLSYFLNLVHRQAARTLVSIILSTATIFVRP